MAVKPESRVSYNPVLIVTRHNPRTQKISNLSPADHRERVIPIHLEPGRVVIRRQVDRLLDLTQRINLLITPITMPSIFRLTNENFPEIYENFKRKYEPFIKKLKREIYNDIRKALRDHKIFLSRDEHVKLQNNEALNILKSRKIRNVVDRSLLKFCMENKKNIQDLSLYAKRMEYIHKAITEHGVSIEKAQSDITSLACRSLINNTAIYSFAILALGSLVTTMYFLVTTPKYNYYGP